MPKTAAAPTAPLAPPPPAAPPRLELLPLDRIAESPSNHRSRSWGDMEGLTASIREKGVIEPVLVRPMKGIGENLFMLVFGARRYRASKAAGVATIPAMIRELSDFEVVELQVIENLQRADVHPLEEAEGYEQLLQAKERTYSVDEIAAKVGKSKAYVYGRLKLLALCPAARTAFYEDKLSASVALLLARIPVAELQQKALEEVLEGGEYDYRTGENEPMSYRDAQEHIVAAYTLRLADAPFERGDADLVPGAGVCTTCPKRSGAQPELFADVKSPDVCTDPTCFNAKKDAAWKQKVASAKESGAKVLSASESKKVFDRYNSSGIRRDAPFVRLTEKVPEDPKGRTWKQLLGKEAPQKVVARDPRGAVVELVERDAAIAAAKKAGLAVRTPDAADGFDRAKYEREEKLRREVQRRTVAAIVARLEAAAPNAKLWRFVAEVLVDGNDAEPVLARRLGDDWDEKAARAAIGRMTEAQLRAFVLEAALAPAIYYGHRDDSKALLAWAKVDGKAIEKEARQALKDAEKPAAKNAGAPLTWNHEDDGRVIGVAGDGLIYAVESQGDGFRWVQGKKKSGPLVAAGGKTAKELAMEDAERAERARSGTGSEVCLACGKPASSPSPGCDECDHGGKKAPAKKGGRR
jgi:ParB/RepB/Spo0J family partition protein